MASKMQPGITVDEEVWKEFKNKFENASQAVENLMRLAIGSPSDVPSFASMPSAMVNSITLPDAGSWSFTYNANAVVASNNATAGGTTTYSLTNHSGTGANIIFDLKGGQ